MRHCIIANDAGLEMLKRQSDTPPSESTGLSNGLLNGRPLRGFPVYRDSSLVATEIRSNCRFCEFDKSDQWAIEAGLARIVELPGEPAVMTMDFGRYLIEESHTARRT